MPREIQDPAGVRWTCAQPYAGLSEVSGDRSAARVEGTDRVRVVCTPSGGSRTVELELPADWETELSDEAILRRIGSERG